MNESVLLYCVCVCSVCVHVCVYVCAGKRLQTCFVMLMRDIPNKSIYNMATIRRPHLWPPSRESATCRTSGRYPRLKARKATGAAAP